MRIILHGIECFVGALFFGLLPIVIGFALGWIMHKEKQEEKERKKTQENQDNNIDIE